MLTIAVSSRSLFQLEEANLIFESEGQVPYDAYMRSTEDEILEPGVAFEMIRKFLNLNKYAPEGQRLVNVVLLSRNSPDAGIRVMQSVQKHGLDIERAVFTSGGNRFRSAKALGADLFLCASANDAKQSMENGLASGQIMPRKILSNAGTNDFIRIAFDGDSVIFSNSADEVFREHGLKRFIEHEIENAHIPLNDGPFKKLLEKLSDLQKIFTSLECKPLGIALVTARGVQSHGRVLNTLRSWGITVDEMIFASGAAKGPLLAALEADFFFDDTGRHVDSASEHNISAARVHFGDGGIPEHVADAFE